MSKTYIEKEAALSGLCSDCKGIAYCRVPCALYDYIDDFPSADVKPVVRGAWIEDGCITKCSECGEPKRFPHWTVCPNCGAEMRKEANDE